MVVTLEVFHRDISALNCVLSLNRLLMLVTSDTSQSAISAVPAGPQFTHALEQHATPVGSPKMG